MLTKKEYAVLELRHKKKLTQVELAKQLGISQAAISKFERTAKQKIKDARKVVDVANNLGIKIEEEEL